MMSQPPPLSPEVSVLSALLLCEIPGVGTLLGSQHTQGGSGLPLTLWSSAVIVSNFPSGETGHREGKWLFQGHTASGGESEGEEPGVPGSRARKLVMGVRCCPARTHLPLPGS